MPRSVPVIRDRLPRLYHPADDPECVFGQPADPVRRRILASILADCRAYERRNPAGRIAERLDSRHPYHQLYITFYTAMEATALIEQYSFAWLLTRDRRWLVKAKQWLAAAARWEHSDRIEEHFYTANRYMHAFAVALDWLAGQFSDKEEQEVIDCLVRMMRRWWPEVNQNRHSPTSGHHVVVDNGHFGVAALALLGRHAEAAEWVRAVLDRFRVAVMPNGCGRDGSPIDGPSFWAAENMWMLQFADAARNVTGIDLYRGFSARTRLPLTYLRHLLALQVPPADSRRRRPDGTQVNGHWIVGRDRATAPVLLRFAQEHGDVEMRELALSDPHLGRIHHFGSGVKNSASECIMTYGPYAYCFYEPHFKARRQRLGALSTKLTSNAASSLAVLRSSRGQDAVVAGVWQFTGSTYGMGHLDVTSAGRALFKTISCAETQPAGCGCMPYVGEQPEMIFTLDALQRGEQADRLSVASTRVEQEYWLLRGQVPALLIATRRRPRGVVLTAERGVSFVRLDGRDYLQYSGRRYFNSDEGELRMRVRLRHLADRRAPAVLFNVGIGVPGGGPPGLGVNCFSLMAIDTNVLRFSVQSNRFRVVSVDVPADRAAIRNGVWHEIVARWGGFNSSGGPPFIELELDGHRVRQDDAALFGELGSDSQGLASRQEPRPFNITPRTVLAFGAAVQIPDTGAACDFSEIEMACRGREPLRLRFDHGLPVEQGDGPMGWLFHPFALKKLTAREAVLGADGRRVRLQGVQPYGAFFSKEIVPFAPSGFAATSLKRLPPNEDEGPSLRIRAEATDDELMVLLLAEDVAGVRTRSFSDGFGIRLGGRRHRFERVRRSGGILRRLP